MENTQQITQENVHLASLKKTMSDLQQIKIKAVSEQKDLTVSFKAMKEGFNVNYEMSDMALNLNTSVGSIDPYILLTCGGHSVKSSVVHKGNRNAVWKDSIKVESQGSHLFGIEIFDSNYTADSFVA